MSPCSPRTRSIRRAACSSMPDHRRRGRHETRPRRGRGDDLPDRRRGGERADDDVLAHERQRELRDQRDAHAGSDEALDGLVVVAFEAHLWLEAGGVTAAHDVAGTGARGRRLDPCLPARSVRRIRWRSARRCSRGRAATSRPRAAQPASSPASEGPPRRTRTAPRGPARPLAVAARSPPVRPPRASARPRGRRRGSWRWRAASASLPRSGTRPPADAPRAGRRSRRGRLRPPPGATGSPRRVRRASAPPRSG